MKLLEKQKEGKKRGLVFKKKKKKTKNHKHPTKKKKKKSRELTTEKTNPSTILRYPNTPFLIETTPT